MSPRRVASETQKPANSAADRVLRVLSEFRDGAEELGVTELSLALEMDKSVVHRILTTLTQHHFLEQNPDTRRYRVGLRAWELGQRYTVRSWLGEAAVPLLAELVTETGGSGYVGSLDGVDLVYLATVDGSGPIRVHVDVGSRTSAQTTALGRAMLAALPPSQLDVLLREMQFAQRREGGGRGQTQAEFLDELEQTRRRGYGLNRGEHRPGIGAVGAAITDSKGVPVAGISVGFPLMAEYEQLWEVVPPRLVRVAREISRRMG